MSYRYETDSTPDRDTRGNVGVDAKKGRKPSKLRAQKVNNSGPCPGGHKRKPDGSVCKHPPVDHRPVANTKLHFCYGPGCMNACG